VTNPASSDGARSRTCSCSNCTQRNSAWRPLGDREANMTGAITSSACASRTSGCGVVCSEQPRDRSGRVSLSLPFEHPRLQNEKAVFSANRIEPHFRHRQFTRVIFVVRRCAVASRTRPKSPSPHLTFTPNKNVAACCCVLGGKADLQPRGQRTGGALIRADIAVEAAQPLERAGQFV